MKIEEDADKRLKTETVRYMHEAGTSSRNARMYREEVFAREQGLSILQKNISDLQKTNGDVERRLYNKHQELLNQEATTRSVHAEWEATEYQVSQACHERNIALESVRELKTKLLEEHRSP